MELHAPIIITPRLLPGLRIGETFISIDYSARPGDSGRVRYEYHIDGAAFAHSADDLQSGASGGTLTDGLACLLSFLVACAESVNYADRTGRESENSDLFPPNVADWAAQNADEISILEFEMSEAESELIIE